MTDSEIRKALTVLARSFGNNFPRFCPLLCILYGSLSLILWATGYETDCEKLFIVSTVLLFCSNRSWYLSEDERYKEMDNPASRQEEDPVSPGRD